MPPKKQKKQQIEDEEEEQQVVVQKREVKRTAKQIILDFYNLDTNVNNNTSRGKYYKIKMINMDISQKLKMIEENIGFKDGVYCCWKLSEVMNFQMKLLIEDVTGFKVNLEKALGDDDQGLFRQLKKQTAKQLKAEGEKNEEKQIKKGQRGKRENEENDENQENEEGKEKKKRRRKPREIQSQNDSFVEEQEVNESKLSALQNLKRLYRKMGLPEDMDTEEEDRVMYKFTPEDQRRISAYRAMKMFQTGYDDPIKVKTSEEERLRILSRQSISDDGVQSNKSSGEDSNREPLLKVTQLDDPMRQKITQSDPSEGQQELYEQQEFPKSRFELQQELIQKAIKEHELALETRRKEIAEKRAGNKNQPKQPKAPTHKIPSFYKIDQEIHITSRQIQIAEKIQKIEKYNENYQYQRMADEQARDTERIRAMAEKYNEAKAQKLAQKRREESIQFENMRRSQDGQDFVQDSPRQYNLEEEVNFKNKGMTLKAEFHSKVIKFNQFAEKSNILFGESKAQAFYSLMIMARTGQAKIEDKNKNKYKFSELYIQL